MESLEYENELINAYQIQETCMHLREKYGMNDYNRGHMLYALSSRMMGDIRNKELRSIFLYGICDDGYLFEGKGRMDKQEVLESYRITQKRLCKFEKLFKQERDISLLWKQIEGIRSLITPQQALLDAFETEVTWLCRLFREIFEITEEQSPELYNNLQFIVSQARQNEDFKKILPFYVFQVMIRHTNRLTNNQNLQIVPSGLWKYREYRIEKNNGKNFTQYEKYIRLFCKLCKYYKADANVNIYLCRYGMEQCSNLSDWVSVWWPKKEKKVRSKLHIFIKNLNVSCIESDVSVEKSVYGYIDFKKSEEERLFQIDANSDFNLTSTIKQYVLEHIEVLVSFMEYHYLDMDRVMELIREVYLRSGCEKKMPGNISVGSKYIYVYEQLVDMLEEALEAKVWDAVREMVEEERKN